VWVVWSTWRRAVGRRRWRCLGWAHYSSFPIMPRSVCMLVWLVVSVGFLWELGFERDMRIRRGQGRQMHVRLMRPCAIEGLRKILVDRLANGRSGWT
jgi:hypothetical protein